MKSLKFYTAVFILATAICSIAQTLKVEKLTPRPEEIIRGYFDGWVKKDWNTVADHLADGFTFTSPAPDDHIDVEQFKAKCWLQAEHIKGFEFVKIIANEKEAFAMVHVITTESKVIRNTEYFTFDNGKIKSIEVFFGGNGQGYPTNEKHD